jgi:hypothetical protein
MEHSQTGKTFRKSCTGGPIFIAGSMFMKVLLKCLGIATTALTLTAFASARVTQNANHLVAADAELQHSLSAKTAKPGQIITARLTESVHMADGKELPRNTVLLGHIDKVQPSLDKSISKIVLTFNEARLQNGQKIPVKGAIIGVYPEGTETSAPDLSSELKVEQEPSSSHGYALTSSINSSNSGILTANGKNVRLVDGTELQFALAPARSSIAGGS